MPNPHFDVQVISRGQGQSVVAAAAYRSGEVLYDEKADKTFDYSRKEDVVHAEIMAALDAPAWVTDRSQLWNKIEAAEKRKDARLARSIIAGLPRELNREQNIALIRGFIQERFISEGLIADFAIHESDAGDGLKNPHAHILLTDRAIGQDGFRQKNRALNSKDALISWRTSWEKHTNRQLELAGREERVSLKSFKAQGINKHPTVHLGEDAGNLEKRGIETNRGNKNRHILHENTLIEILGPAYEAELADAAFGQDSGFRSLTADQTLRLEAMTLELKDEQEEYSDAKGGSGDKAGDKEANLNAFKNDEADPQKLAEASMEASRSIHEAALREYLASPQAQNAKEQVMHSVRFKEYTRRHAERIKEFSEKVYQQFSNLRQESGRLKEKERDDRER